MHKKRRGVPSGRNLLIAHFVSRSAGGNALEIPSFLMRNVGHIMEPYANSGDKIAQFIVGFCYYNMELEIKIELLQRTTSVS